MSVAEYECEFVKLSKYAQECISNEAIMCKRFEDGLNKDIRLLVRILELKEFVVLVGRACKAEELNKKNRKAMIEARDARKRPMSKSFQSQSKRSKKRTLRRPLQLGIHTEIVVTHIRALEFKPPRWQVWVMQSQINLNVRIMVDNILGSVGGTIELVTSAVH
ncbi:Gag-Pol polyprotein [Gossypium australe]|uniref:Gag-Pol polyprotein n=1 Tax=Gossypium australe TaxID=47621 RepID=A0A5B6X198_9ROSI|nr:Gag-Pol polyprotein [Gossypium australe]